MLLPEEGGRGTRKEKTIMFYPLITWNVSQRRYCPILVGHEDCKYLLDFYNVPHAMLDIFRFSCSLNKTFIDHLPKTVHTSKPRSRP